MYLVRDEVDGEQKPVTEMKMLLMARHCYLAARRRREEKGQRVGFVTVPVCVAEGICHKSRK